MKSVIYNIIFFVCFFIVHNLIAKSYDSFQLFSIFARLKTFYGEVFIIT